MMRTLLIFTTIALCVSVFWYVPAVNHHGDIVKVCKEKGYVKSIFGEDIKCEEMKVKK